MIALFHKRKTINGAKKTKKISLSTMMILEEAEKHGVTWGKIPYTGLFKLQHKKKIKYFHAQTPSETTEFAYHCCKNKQLANHILENEGLSISKGYLIKHDDDELYCAGLFHDLQKPLVVKPADAAQGKNVYLHIASEYRYAKAIKEIRAFNGKRKINILVEEMFMGDEYRILATQKKTLSVIKRIAANVVGDGKSTIQELAAIKNRDPIRLKITTYQPISLDEKVQSHLHKQGLTFESVIESGKRIFLLPKSPFDISVGGDTVDVTDKIHPSVSKIVRKIMKSIPGLSLAGIDFMTTNIQAKQTANSYRIIEINASPSLDWNQHPLEGNERDVAYQVLQVMFPELT